MFTGVAGKLGLSFIFDPGAGAGSPQSPQQPTAYGTFAGDHGGDDDIITMGMMIIMIRLILL